MGILERYDAKRDQLLPASSVARGQVWRYDASSDSSGDADEASRLSQNYMTSDKHSWCTQLLYVND